MTTTTTTTPTAAKLTWTTLLDAAALDAYFVRVAVVDQRYATAARLWWEARTPPQLAAARAGAWDCNDLTTYVLARSYQFRTQPAHA